MLAQFLLSLIVVCGALYVPGFFVLKAARLSCWRSVAFAPLVSLVLLCLLGIAYDKLGLPATGLSLLVPATLVALISFVVSSLACKGRAAHKVRHAKQDASWPLVVPLAYVAIGIALYSIVYLSALPTLDNVAETYDNVFHFNLIRSFVESGSWSTLNATTYLDTVGIYAPPFVSASGYYPSAWHLVCGLPVSLLDMPVGLASNATNFVFIACVYPISMCYFIQKLFSNDRLAVVLGMFITFAFGAYPWVLLAHWPLYPNLVSMTMVPLLCAAFIEATQKGVSRGHRAAFAGLFVVGVLAEAFCQPNAVFVAMVLLAPYVVREASRAIQDHMCDSIAVRWIAGIVIVLLIVGVWYVLFKLPFLQPTVNYYWAPIMTTTQAIASSISLSLALPYQQYALGVLILIGAAFIVFKKREYLWLLVSYVLAIAIFVVAASLDNCWLKHFLSGFWYTDPYRVAAMVGMAGIPVAILGLLALCTLVQWLVAKMVKRPSEQVSMRKNVIVNGVVVLLVCCAIYIPGVVGSYGSGMFFHLHDIAGAHTAGTDRVPYDDEEKAFVNKVNEIVAEDDVVLNNPYDGSMMAYGLSDLPIYYRSISGYGRNGETEDSALLRERFSALASSDEVQAILDSISADYVLVLENDAERMALFYPTYEQGAWDGFESITDSTPGLELVLSDGEMKLYKIVIP